MNEFELNRNTGTLIPIHSFVYSTNLGRFLQPDLIGTQSGLNVYAYTGNDPVNATDPTGLDTQVTIGYTHTPMPGYYHQFVILTDTVTGQQYATRGGPAIQNASAGSSASAESSAGGSISASAGNAGSGGFGFGPITGLSDYFDPSFRDPPSKIVATQPVGTIPLDYSEAVNDAKNFVDMTNQTSIPYFPTGPNSNSYASTFVQSLTGTRPEPILSAPGWDQGTPSSSLSYSPSPLRSRGNGK